MRDFSFLADKRLGGDGANLSTVLYRLWYGGMDRSAYESFVFLPDYEGREKHADFERQEILSLIQSLPEQDIQGLSFLEGPRSDVLEQLVERIGRASCRERV